MAAPEAAAAAAPGLLGVLWLVSVTVSAGPWGAVAAAAGGDETVKCEDLRMGQYVCRDPEINEATQEPVNCTNYTAHVSCYPAPNVTCKDFSGNETHFTGSEVGFFKTTSCRNVNGYSYRVAVALSLFLGWLGADRFYLGYPALDVKFDFCTNPLLKLLFGFCFVTSQMVAPFLFSLGLWSRITGLLKFCTVGFCGIGSLIDFILISMQIVGPSDGTSYIIDYYGTRLTRLSITNETFRKTQKYP